MTAQAPDQLRVDGHWLIVLERTLNAALPEEGCALLLGKTKGSSLELHRVWPCCNRWEPAHERDHRFLLDPREQLLAQRWAREHGLQGIGSAHSHPTSAAIPSQTDRELCFGPTLMVIASGLGNERWRAWWLSGDDDACEPRELPLRQRLAAGDQRLGK